MASNGCIEVSVVYSDVARHVHEFSVQLPCTGTVIQAIEASGLLRQFPDLDVHTCVVGVWGRRVSLAHVLRTQDRIEIYRPLTVDPKVARRTRFAKQGARGAGLFARRRPQVKKDY